MAKNWYDEEKDNVDKEEGSDLWKESSKNSIEALRPPKNEEVALSANECPATCPKCGEGDLAGGGAFTCRYTCGHQVRNTGPNSAGV